MQPSESAALEDEKMTAVRGDRPLRQYGSRRLRKEGDDARTSETSSPSLEKGKPSVETLSPSSAVCTPVKTVSSTSGVSSVRTSFVIGNDNAKGNPSSKFSTPQVIVRQFTLNTTKAAVLRPSFQHTVPGKNTIHEFQRIGEFQKPKQRWKQLCNLNQELSTTVSKVKLMSTSKIVSESQENTSLINVTKGDVNSAHVKLLSSSKVVSDTKEETFSTAGMKSMKAVNTATSPDVLELLCEQKSSVQFPQKTSQTAVSSGISNTPITSPNTVPNLKLATVPASSKSSAVKNIVLPQSTVGAASSPSPTIRHYVLPFTAVSTGISNSSPAVKNIVYPLTAVSTAPTAVSSLVNASVKNILLPLKTVSAAPTAVTPSIIGSFPSASSVKNNSPLPSAVTTSSNGVSPPTAPVKNVVLSLCSSSPTLTTLSLKNSHSVNSFVKHITVPTNAVISSLQLGKSPLPSASESRIGTSTVKKNISSSINQTSVNVTNAVCALPSQTVTLSNKTESNNMAATLDSKSTREFPCNISKSVKFETVQNPKTVLLNANHEIVHCVNDNNKSVTVVQNSQKPSTEEISEPRRSKEDKERSHSLLKATLLGADSLKELTIPANLTFKEKMKFAHSASESTLRKTVQSDAAQSLEAEEKQSSIKQMLKRAYGSEKIPDDMNLNGDVKAPLKRNQLEREIALLKTRQNIALLVDRKILRAKDVKVTREVMLPARKIKISDAGTQTDLFSLVEPGRVVEINSSKSSESGTVVGSKGKQGTGEDSTGGGGQPMKAVSIPEQVGGSPEKITNMELETVDSNIGTEEPINKRARLDGTSACDLNSNERTAVSEAMLVNSVSNKDLSLLPKGILIPVNSKLGSDKIQTQLLLKELAKAKKDEDNAKSVFELIVQHNIKLQYMADREKYSNTRVPENSSKNSKHLSNAEIKTVKNVNIQQTSENSNSENKTVKNVNIQQTSENFNSDEIAAKISALKSKAFKDWLNCLVPDDNGNIPLHRAVLDENLVLVKRYCAVLAARKESLDILNYEQKTPLHLAVVFGNVEIVKTLVGFGAQPGVKDKDGNTALHLAVLVEDNIDCVNELLNASALPLDDFNDEGYAPLHLCAVHNKVEETRALINRGADVNLKDARSGRTALFHAVESNNRKLVKTLLQLHASTNEPNFAGHTALSAASEIASHNTSNVNDYVPETMNFNTRLVSLANGEDLLRDNLILTGQIVEDISMEDDDADDVGLRC